MSKRQLQPMFYCAIAVAELPGQETGATTFGCESRGSFPLRNNPPLALVHTHALPYAGIRWPRLALRWRLSVIRAPSCPTLAHGCTRRAPSCPTLAHGGPVSPYVGVPALPSVARAVSLWRLSPAAIRLGGGSFPRTLRRPRWLGKTWSITLYPSFGRDAFVKVAVPAVTT